MSPFLGELVGTASLVMLGDAVMARVRLADREGEPFGEGRIALGWSMAVFTGMLIASLASGAHLNPAVTIGLSLSGMFPAASVSSYLIAQGLGALVGSALAWLACLPQWPRTGSPTATLACFCSVPAIRAPLGNLMATVVGSAVMVLAFLSLRSAVEISTDVLVSVVLWSAGGAAIVLALGLGVGLTHGLNPARDIGGRLAHALLPLPAKGDSDWNGAWIPLIGPLLGAMLAAWVFRAIVPVDVA